jgi:Ni,Fe-hydrogenase III large subunit
MVNSNNHFTQENWRSCKNTEYTQKIRLDNYCQQKPLELELVVKNGQIQAGKFLSLSKITEKIQNTIQQSSWKDGVKVIGDHSPFLKYHYQLGFINSFEQLAKGIAIPKRAIYLRTIVLEFERIINHLLTLSLFARGISALIFYSRIEKKRKKILELFQIISSTDQVEYFTFGGVHHDISKNQLIKIKNELDEEKKAIKRLLNSFKRNPMLKQFTKDVGFLPRDEALELNLTGPIARSSGITNDIRQTSPYGTFNEIPLVVPVYDRCDLYAELLVKFDEIFCSINYIQKLIDLIPVGIIQATDDNFFTRKGTTTTKLESPEGELFMYFMSEEGGLDSKPKISRIIPPAISKSQGILARMTAETMERIPTILYCFGEGWGYIRINSRKKL